MKEFSFSYLSTLDWSHVLRQSKWIFSQDPLQLQGLIKGLSKDYSSSDKQILQVLIWLDIEIENSCYSFLENK